MKSVVFGGSGFLGSYVVDALTEQGHDVRIFDRTPSKYLNDSERMIIGDILDSAAVISAVEGSAYVFHFAGMADIRDCARNPVEAVKANVLSTAIILEACVQAKVQRFIFASSLYVNARVGNFYRTTKRACEGFVEDYQSEYGLDYTILRFGTVYGQRADDKNSLYRFITQALETGRISYAGTGEEVREYIHALDAARQTVALLDEVCRNKKYLITGNHPTRITDLFNMIEEIIGRNLTIDYSTKLETFDYHYRISSYAYQEDHALKVSNPHYIDLGQGILDLIRYLKESENAV